MPVWPTVFGTLIEDIWNSETFLLEFMKNKMIAAMLAAAFFGAGFFLGERWGHRNILSYLDSGLEVTFDRRATLYGLNLTENVALLRMLRSGMVTESIGRLEDVTDLGIENAKFRYQILSPVDKEPLRRALAQVASYRLQYPRRLAEGSGFYLTAEKQIEIYSFLTNFNSLPK